MHYQKSRLRRDMMNDFRAYQSIVDETDKITSCIKISANPNAIYGSDGFHDMVVLAAASNSYISGSASAMRRTAASDCGSMGAARRIPTDEWYRDILSKMDDGEVTACIENTISSQIDRLRKMGRIPADGMTIAIDAHLIPCYCKDHESEMIHSRSKRGTDYFIRYVTAQCVDRGARLMPAAIHMPALESMSDFVHRLVDLARQAGADTRLILLAREFFATDVMKTLGDMKVRYITPCRNTGTVVDTLDEFAAGRRGRISESCITNADRVSVTYTMIITERTRRKKNSKNEPKNRYIGFATNAQDIDAAMYGQRWGIETGYKMLEAMRPRTRSRNIAARNFCFLYAVVMFNAWVLANAMLADCSDQADAAITQAHFKFMLEITLLLSSIIPPEPPPDPVAP